MKFWNTLLYGSKKAKQCILTIIAFLIIAIGLITASVALSAPSLGGIAFFVFLIDLLYASSVSWKDLERQEKREQKRREKLAKVKNGKNVKKRHAGKHEKESAVEENDVCEETDTQETAKLYKGKNLKKVLYQYKVKKQHKCILVDSYPKYHIRQCPAFIWTEKGMLRFLFLTEEPLKTEVPLKEVTTLYYVPDVEADPMEDYRELFDSEILNLVFSPYLPSQYMVDKNGRRVMCKNLYELANGIRLTNLSAKELLSLVSVRFEVQDAFMQSSKIDEYSKEVYRYCVLWRDGVLDTGGYKAEVSRILKSMMETGMPQANFQQNMRNMVQRRLITREFADYYINQYKI